MNYEGPTPISGQHLGLERHRIFYNSSHNLLQDHLPNNLPCRRAEAFHFYFLQHDNQEHSPSQP
uniref:Uncharacterized protein n=1 Tax=Rhizophora mucronata TaxID=61149 RepID=A0A2P2IU99_RHIMU